MTKKIERVLTGVVVSDIRDKTISVLIERQIKHPVYKKFIKRTSKVHAHDEKNECGLGDVVKVVEVAPMSKTKHWSLIEVLEKAPKV
ncbi:SSU ribosomal protein S17p (S11e) [hydrothermal vent metagenome]|uniref:SSU ribosomal protein S17p (S11e) n=1 Tax=hydrothermal vent metagenome TaxID=652676 RepID=A0A1W1BKI7_9ZZZZ